MRKIEPTPIILDLIALLIIKSVLRRGFSSMTVSLGGMEARAKAAKVSIIRFTHNICVTVSGSSVPITEPSRTISNATKLIVSWKTMKRWIFLYNERPHITAVPILLKESSSNVISLASLATEVPVPIDKPT